MLHHPTLDKLYELRLLGMAKALEEQRASQACEALIFEDRLALLVDREYTERDNKRLQIRLKKGPSYARPPPWRTWTTAPPAASTKPCSSP